MTTDPIPPYEQLRRQLVALIQAGVLARASACPRSGNWPPTWAWPSARTYRELETAGLVTSR